MAYHSAAADHDKAAVMVVNISAPDFDTAFVQGKWYLMIKNYHIFSVFRAKRT